MSYRTYTTSRYILSQVENQRVSKNCFKYQNSITFARPRSAFTVTKFAQQEMILSPEGIECIKRLSLRQRLVLNHFIWMASRGMKLSPSQQHLGYLVDVCRQQVNRYIAEFKQLGLIAVYYRGRNKTALYRLSPWLYKESTWQALQDYIPMFRSFVMGFMSISLLMLQPDILLKECTQSQHVTLLNIPSYLSFFNSSTVPHSLTAGARAREKTNKRSMTMKQFSPLLQNEVTKALRLTFAGQAKLCIYNDAALQFALNRYNKAHKSTIKDTMRFFMAACNEYYRTNLLSIDFKPYNDIAKLYNLGEDDALQEPIKQESMRSVQDILKAQQPKPHQQKTSFYCKVGYTFDCKKKGSLEHSQRAVAQQQSKPYQQPTTQPVPCVLECTQPCKVNGVFTAQHNQRYQAGLDFINSMMPSHLKDEVLQKYTARFAQSSPASYANTNLRTTCVEHTSTLDERDSFSFVPLSSQEDDWAEVF